MGKGAKQPKQTRFQIIQSRLSALRKKYQDSPHRSFKKSTAVRPAMRVRVREGWQLIVETTLFLKQHKKIYIWLIIAFGILTYLMVGGISQSDYVALKDSSKDLIGEGLDAITTAGAYFGAAVTGGLTQAPSEIQQFLSGVLALLFWLIIIWMARMMSAGEKIKIRDALYNSPTPLISTIVTLAFFALQLIPAAIGLFGFTIAMTEQWITGPLEAIAFGAAAVLLCTLSLYWITGTVVALAIVTLPGMYPMRALSSARQLVMGNRSAIVMRLIVAIIIQLLIWAIIMIPLFLLDNWLRFDWLPLIPVAVQLMVGFSLVFTSTYVYKLYRSLL